ncbi:MAG: response regulator transcription factor [Acidobacteriota bacterium]|nr:response regulator transcription factor [Acidobacteriota bacterium]
MSTFHITGANHEPRGRFRTRVPRIGVEPRRDEKSARILIADDHQILRDGLRFLLETESDFRVVGEAADSDMTVRLVQELKPDVLLLDWSMAIRDGMRVMREVSASGLPVRILLQTVSLDKADILQALQLGAWGVILRNSTTDMLFEGIRRVVSGQYWITQDSVATLVEALRDSRTPEPAPAPRRDFGLTKRELQIVEAVVEGFSNADIAANMKLSEHTVKHHIGHAFDKLGVSNRLELALFAINHQLTGEHR